MTIPTEAQILAVLHRVALTRPDRWPGATAYPTRGAFCAKCDGTTFVRHGDGWACHACHPNQEPSP